MKILVIASAALALTGCATVAEPPVAVGPFDAAAYAWSKGRGSNTITGDAVLRTRGGDVKTCAGLAVKLLPVGPDTDAFMDRHFGSAAVGGYYPVPPLFGRKQFLRPELSEFTRAKTCNAQGQFAFSGLPDGEYYVVATVTWEAPTGGSYSYMETQGGDIAKRVKVSGGQTESITLTS